jgi:hypothetical protein
MQTCFVKPPGLSARTDTTAAQMVPGDLGTKGGLAVDENARVLRDSGEPLWAFEQRSLKQPDFIVVRGRPRGLASPSD